MSEIPVNLKVYDLAVKDGYIFSTPAGDYLSHDQSTVTQISINSGEKKTLGLDEYNNNTIDASNSNIKAIKDTDTLVLSGDFTTDLIDYQTTENQTFRSYSDHCGTVWPFGELYLTACGEVYDFTRTINEWEQSSLEEQYSGSIQTVFNSGYSSSKLVNQFIDYPPLNEFTVVEYSDPYYGIHDWLPISELYSVISQHSRDYLTKKASHSLPYVEIDNEYYKQLAEHVFYDNKGLLNVVSRALRHDSEQIAYVLNKIAKP